MALYYVRKQEAQIVKHFTFEGRGGHDDRRREKNQTTHIQSGKLQLFSLEQS